MEIMIKANLILGRHADIGRDQFLSRWSKSISFPKRQTSVEMMVSCYSGGLSLGGLVNVLIIYIRCVVNFMKKCKIHLLTPESSSDTG